MVIVKYKNKYREPVIKLILDIQNNEAGINLSLQEQPDLNDIYSAYIKNGGCFWIALNEKEEVVGTIGLMKRENSCGILKKFFVRLDYRSQKVGLHLYLSLIDFCANHNFKALLLDTPAVAKASHRFYERNGFIKITKKDLPVPYEFPDRNSYLYVKYL